MRGEAKAAAAEATKADAQEKRFAAFPAERAKAEKAAADAADGRDELGEDGEPIPATMTAWRGKLRNREAETALLRGRVRGCRGAFLLVIYSTLGHLPSKTYSKIEN